MVEKPIHDADEPGTEARQDRSGGAGEGHDEQQGDNRYGHSDGHKPIDDVIRRGIAPVLELHVEQDAIGKAPAELGDHEHRHDTQQKGDHEDSLLGLRDIELP